MEEGGVRISMHLFWGNRMQLLTIYLPLQSFVRDQEVKEMSDKAVITCINKIQLTRTSGNLEILIKMDFCLAG